MATRWHSSLPSRGDEKEFVYITFNPIDVAALLNEARPSDGGVCVFLGVVRNENDGRPTVSIQYQVYGPMAEAEMGRIVRQIGKEWPEVRLHVQHRAGDLGIGE